MLDPGKAGIDGDCRSKSDEERLKLVSVVTEDVCFVESDG